MKRTMIFSAAVLFAWLGLVSVSDAQVFIRAPFVRVAVGDGVYVRAPFVNLYIPGDGPAYYGPRVIYMPPPVVLQPPASEPLPPPVKPPVKGEFTPPQPMQVQTHEAFAKSFQAKAGSYEVTMLNPVTKQPATVRFILPEGTPRRVVVTRDSVEFIYGLRQWVRIEFDRDGATITAR